MSSIPYSFPANRNLINQLRCLEQHRDNLQSQLSNIQSAKAYKIWQDFAHIKRGVMKIRSKKISKRVFTKLFSIYKSDGLNGLYLYIRSLGYGEQLVGDAFTKYQIWMSKYYPTTEILLKQKKASAQLKKRPLLSVIIPTYNTNKNFLIDCIESVINQSYDNWELCIADDHSSDKHVKNIISQYAKKDSRIKVTYRSANGHICKASNSALELASGDYVALLDHDDILWPNALFEVVKSINENPDAEFIYSDEDKLMTDGITHTEPFFKPDWSPDYLRSINYITHFAVIKRKIVEELGGFRIGTEGAQDWDLFLRVADHLEKKNKTTHPFLRSSIIHVTKILYSWRISPNSTASEAHAENAKAYAFENQIKVLNDALVRRKTPGSVQKTDFLGLLHVNYLISRQPLVSIIIPTKNQFGYISKCLESILTLTTYSNYEVIIVDTGSDDHQVIDLYENYTHKNKVSLLHWQGEFNFSDVSNYGAENSKGKYLLFLNNDTQVITEDWIEQLLGYAQQRHIGAVGAKLYYPDEKIQHLGGLLGIKGDPSEIGIAGHAFSNCERHHRHFDMQATKNYSFVTGACLMIKRSKYDEVGGFDPLFKIAFNDIDFCLKLNEHGLFNCVVPQVELYHKESASLKKPGEDGRNIDDWKSEIKLFMQKWDKYRKNDPFFNSNLSRNRTDFNL